MRKETGRPRVAFPRDRPNSRRSPMQTNRAEADVQAPNADGSQPTRFIVAYLIPDHTGSGTTRARLADSTADSP